MTLPLPALRWVLRDIREFCAVTDLRDVNQGGMAEHYTLSRISSSLRTMRLSLPFTFLPFDDWPGGHDLMDQAVDTVPSVCYHVATYVAT